MAHHLPGPVRAGPTALRPSDWQDVTAMPAGSCGAMGHAMGQWAATATAADGALERWRQSTEELLAAIRSPAGRLEIHARELICAQTLAALETAVREQTLARDRFLVTVTSGGHRLHDRNSTMGRPGR